MGVAFACMLAVSVWHRFTRPALVVNVAGGSRAAGMAATPAEMDAVGPLMREVAKNPRDSRALARLIESLMALGQWQSAENFAEKAVALEGGDNEDYRASYLLAIIHHNQGRHEQAAEILEKILAKKENPSARYSLGILYNHFLGQPLKGREQLNRGLESGLGSESLRRAMRDELAKTAK